MTPVGTESARHVHTLNAEWVFIGIKSWFNPLMLIFDAHLDLSMDALEWNRDYTRPISEIREREQGMTDKPDRGRGTVCFPEMRRGGIGICVATQIARYVKRGNPLPGWHSPEQAWAQTQGQLAWYRAMEERGELVQIKTRGELQASVRLWSDVSLSPQRGEGRGEGWDFSKGLPAEQSAGQNHPSPSIPLPVEGRGKSYRRRLGLDFPRDREKPEP